MTRKPTFAEALVPLLGMVLLLGVGYGKYGLPIQFLLIVAAFIAAIIAKRCGYTWQDMITGIADKIQSSLPSLLVMVCVGAMIASWMISGTIPLLIYYGVAIMGIAIALGVPLEIAAGAVISGAVFGDKLSPLSDTTMLAPIAAGTDLYAHIKHMLYTTGAATITCAIVFTTVGLNMDVSTMTNPETVQAILTNLEQLYNFNLFLLLPPVLIFWGAYTKKPTIPMLLLASIIAIAMGMYFQGFDLKTALQAFVNGFKVTMIPGVADIKVAKPIITLLNRGGLMGMMSTVLLVFCAFAFAGIFSKTGCIEVVLERIISSIKSVGQLVTATVGSTLFMSIVTGSSYLAILIPGEMFRDLYKKFGLEPKNLSRTLEDAGTCAVPIVPWSVAGTYMATTLGVPTTSYMPWAILCYSSMIFAIIFGYTGFGIAKIKK